MKLDFNANLLRYFALRHLITAPVRTVLTGFGVALGIALYFAIALINRSTLDSFHQSVDAVVGKASLTVSAGDTGFPDSVEEKLKALPGVKSTAPMIEAKGNLDDPKGGADTLVIFGIDLLKEQSVRSYKTDDGHGNEQVMDDPLEFLNQPDSIILTRSFAAKHGFKSGDKVVLSTAFGAKTFTVRGLLSPSGPAKAFGGGIAIMDIDGARLAFAKENKVDRIDLVLADGANREQVASAAKALLGPGYQVLPPETQSENLTRMVASFQGMLSFLSLLALLIGVVLVANSVAVSVAERRREIGTLRALGATRARVLLLILAENVILGAGAGALGAALGRGLASQLVASVTGALGNQIMSKVEVETIRFSGSDVLAAVLLGAGVSLLASLWPAIRAMRISPVEALKPKGVDPALSRAPSMWLRTMPIIGAAFLVYLGASAHFRAGVPPSTAANAIEPAMGVIGAALVAPFLVVMLVRAILAVVPRDGARSLIFRTAAENLLRNPGRTASNVLSLIVGLMLVIIVGAVNLSFRDTIAHWTQKVIAVGDMALSSNGRVVQFQVQPLHESLLEKINAIPGIDHSPRRSPVTLRYVRLNFEGQELAIKALDPPPVGSDYPFIDSKDVSAQVAGDRLFGRAALPGAPGVPPGTMDAVLVSENFVAKFRHSTGDTIELDTPSGRIPFRIASVVRDFANPNGVLYLSRPAFRKYWHDSLVTAFFVSAAPGTTPQELQARINSDLGRRYGIISVLNTELVAQLVQVIDQSFSFNLAVQAAALLVGLIGLLNTTLVSVLERTREFGTLRAVGMSRSQLATLLLWECFLQGGLGSVVAVGLGAYISRLWVTVNLSAGLGWVIDYSFPLGASAQVFAAGLLVSLIAGVAPALRAAGLSVRSALEYE